MRTLNSVWWKLWPDAIPELDFEGFCSGERPPAEEEDGIVEEEIATLGRDMVLEMDTEDIYDLIGEHADE